MGYDFGKDLCIVTGTNTVCPRSPAHFFTRFKKGHGFLEDIVMAVSAKDDINDILGFSQHP